jgi:hypothetical protein
MKLVQTWAGWSRPHLCDLGLEAASRPFFASLGHPTPSSSTTSVSSVEVLRSFTQMVPAPSSGNACFKSVGHRLVYDKTDASRLLGVGHNTIGVYLVGGVIASHNPQVIVALPEQTAAQLRFPAARTSDPCGPWPVMQ